jgi:hypothetical protein
VNVLRRIAFPLRLAAVRITHRPGRATVLAAGIAAGAAVLALVLGGSLVAQDEQASRALERVPAGERTLAAVYADLGVARQGDTIDTIDSLVQRQLGSVVEEEPVRVLQYKLLTIDGTLVNLAAMDGLENWVRLTSGRFPTGCTAERCEVVELAGGGPIPSRPGLRFVKVGEGTLTSPALFGRLPGAEAARIGESFRPERQPPFLLAEGFAELAGLPELRSLYRTYVWVVPLDSGDIRPWELDGFLDGVTRARATLRAASPVLDVAAPTDHLGEARTEGSVAGHRLLLIGGQAAALLLAFALLTAASMRRETDLAWSRLTWRGARRWQLLLMSGTEAGMAALAGAVVGWAAGTALTALLAERASSPAGEILGHSVLGSSGLAAAGIVAGAATLVVLLGLRAPALPVGGRSLTTLDVAALGALVAVLVALARGQADAGELAGSDSVGTFLLLLPGLVTFIVAVACARLLGPGLRLLGRAARGARVSVRLAALSLARSPGRAAVSVTFLVASLGLALFAVVYRSTLEGGNRDQAAYAVPLDFRVQEDLSPSKLVPPLEAAPLSGYESLAPGLRVVPVIRQTGSVGAFGGSNRFTLLGLPSGSLPSLGGWRGDFAELPRTELAARIRPEGDVALQGPEIPPDATALVLPVSVVGGDVSISADVATKAGRFLHLDLGVTAGRERRELVASLPEEARGGRLIALALGRAAAVEEHASEFTRVDGVLRLGPLAAETAQGRTRLLEDYRGWEGVNGATPLGSSTVRYLVNEAAERRFQAPQLTDGEAVPVVSSPALANAVGEDGLLPLRVPGGVLRARVVAVAEHFPTLEDDFVVADRSFLFTALNSVKPGAATLNEVWIGAPDDSIARAVSTGLVRPPFDVLAVSSRRAIADELAGNPLSRGALAILAAAAVGSILLALLGLLLLLTADVRDERGELLDLEAQGAGPSLLRRHLRLRATLVVGLGLIGGLVAAALLAALVVGVVTVTAAPESGEPPLVLGLDLPFVVATCLGFTVAAALVIWAATRRAPA